jgi:predicted amidohydrolase
MTGKMTSTATRVGVIQVTSTADVERNLEAVERTVGGAADAGAELVVVPECFAYLGPEEGKLALAESVEEGGPILDRMAALARDKGVSLILGGHWERAPTPGKVYNASVHLRPDGSVASVYRKLHLFDVDLADGTSLRESDSVEAGDALSVSETRFGLLGMSICYDLRFAELYRALAERGAIAFSVPAAFTLHTGKDHWHVLLRARAIEQQCYVLAAAQTGHHYGKRYSYGHALIADHWGTVLAQVGEGEGFAVATVDPAVVARVRASIPCLQHRKL